jgi:putative SOS response-associated peptidase YedK
VCYYVASKLSGSEIYQLEHDFVVKWEEEETDAYYAVSGFAHPKLPVITSEKRFRKMSWGLIPLWVKDWDTAKKLRVQTLNAQCEGVDTKPSFRGAIKGNRFCIVPVNGYYEWHHHANGQKYPHFIYPKNDKIFYLAGIFEKWINPANSEVIETFSILTSAANDRMAFIHNSKKRMPLILSKDNAKLWLDTSLPFSEKKQLLTSYDQNEMLDHTISRLITSRKDNPNQPAVVEKFSYPELEG